MAVNADANWDWTAVVLWLFGLVIAALSALVGYFYNQKPGREEVLAMINASLDDRAKTIADALDARNREQDRRHQENQARLRELEDKVDAMPEKVATAIRDFFTFTRGA